MNLFKSKINESEQALVVLQGEFESLNTQFATVQEELATATQLAGTLKAEFERVDSENKALKETIETLNASLAEASRDALKIDEQVSLKAVELLAETGHEQVEILETETEEIDIVSTFKGLKGKELLSFYNTHKQEIAAALKNGR
jgi:chromosome segregation ATPase